MSIDVSHFHVSLTLAADPLDSVDNFKKIIRGETESISVRLLTSLAPYHWAKAVHTAVTVGVRPGGSRRQSTSPIYQRVGHRNTDGLRHSGHQCTHATPQKSQSHGLS